MDKLEEHWQYAFGCAAHSLERWAKKFDFTKQAGNNTYAGSDPRRIISIIDQFLADDRTKVLGGTRKQIEETRAYVKQCIIPIYDQGLVAGKDAWNKSNKIYGSLSTSEIHKDGWDAAQHLDDFKDWYVEAYCFSYSHEEMLSLKKNKYNQLVHRDSAAVAASHVTNAFGSKTIETNPSNLISNVAKQSIEIAMKCIATGETLLPFILTEGNPGAIHSLVGKSVAEFLTMAQNQIDGFGIETKAFAFAYDGFITLQSVKYNCIYIEAAEVGGDRIFMFCQRYHPKKDLVPIERIGNWVCLKQGRPKLKL